MTGSEMHFLSTKGIYIKPLWLVDHEAKMEQLKARLEYNLDGNNIPTWASPERGFLMWKKRNDR